MIGLRKLLRSSPAATAPTPSTTEDLYCVKCGTTIPSGVKPAIPADRPQLHASVSAYYETKDLRKRGWTDAMIANHLRPDEAIHIPLTDGGEVLLWEVNLVLAREVEMRIDAMPTPPIG